MKKTIIRLSFAFALFTTQNLHAQYVQYGSFSAVDQLISNIFGVQCEGVTNVAVVGNPSSIGRFENGNILGLNSGLVLSTGLPETGPGFDFSHFSSTQIGTPGDVDIDAVSSGSFSLDAISISFDFTPQVSDTISFRYIFASEEYPEYVLSNFNDRFLFLVSENTNPAINIATIPGLSTVIEINSVNQYTNIAYYTDGASAPGASFFPFDGYTIPLTAKFYAQVGNTYHVKLVIADVSDGIFDSALFLDEQESYNDISGSLTVGGALADGTLEVFNYIQDTSLAIPVQTIPVVGGSYLADSLPTGNYHIRFTPDPILFPGAAPLYFDNGTTWANANIIGLPCFLDSASINATTNTVGGSGTISGNITIDSSYNKSLQVPFEGAIVKLININSGEIAAFTYSDANGDYLLSGINAGEYQILLDVPYIPQADTHTITLPLGENMVNADYAILTTHIEMSNTAILNLDDHELDYFALYPNPANETVNLRFKKATGETLKIVSVDGQIVLQKEIEKLVEEISIKSFSEGIYFIQVGNQAPQRLMIKH